MIILIYFCEPFAWNFLMLALGLLICYCSVYECNLFMNQRNKPLNCWTLPSYCYCLNSLQPLVLNGEQLLHSEYLQSLCSMTVALGLDNILCQTPKPPHHLYTGKYKHFTPSLPIEGPLALWLVLLSCKWSFHWLRNFTLSTGDFHKQNCFHHNQTEIYS